RMYTRFCERRGWRVEVLSLSEGSLGGLEEAGFAVRGSKAYGTLRYESGVHRVQRVPVTETQGRIHTSAATVAVLPEAEEIDVKIEDKDLRIDVFRSGGPGGQSVNTTDSAVRLTHLPTGLEVKCQDQKSQLQNKIKAMEILRSRLLDRRVSEQEAERSRERRAEVGTGDRSQKVRTYNFPQNRVTDHRIPFTTHSVDQVMDGKLDGLLAAVGQGSEQERGLPFAYAVGSVGFRTLDLAIDRRALIPRPETEGLVELVLARCSGGLVADIGTGSGCIALALAVEGQFDKIVAVEHSPAAAALARENVQRIGPKTPVEIREGNLLAPL